MQGAQSTNGGNGTFREAVDSLDLNIARLKDWQRRFGAEFDRGLRIRQAIDDTEALARVLKRTGEETRPLFPAAAASPPQHLTSEGTARDFAGISRTPPLPLGRLIDARA